MIHNINNRYVLLIILILITAFAVNIFSYSPFDQNSKGMDKIHGIPINFQQWKGYDLSLESHIYNILETQAIIHRQYQSDKGNVFLSLVYYPETKVDFHAPESCLSGRGDSIIRNSKTISLHGSNQVLEIQLNTIIKENQDVKELIYYFYKTGNFVGKSYTQLRIKLAKNKMIGNPRSASLIRLSTPLISIESSDKLLVDFIRDIYPYIIENL